MKISIAIATYNGEKYIEEQLKSIYNQTIKPDEIIISDDNSNDNTLNIINEIKKITNIKHIIIENKKRIGYSLNFNRALESVKGEVIFLCDQDDFWFENKIELVLNQFKENSSIWVVMNDAMFTDESLNELRITKLDEHKRYDRKLNGYHIGCCAAVRKELLDYCLPIPSNKVGHDNWIIGIAEGLGKRKIINLVLQYYRRHGNNQSNTFHNGINVSMMKKYINHIKKKNDNKYEIDHYLLSFMESKKYRSKNENKYIEKLSDKIYVNDIRRRIKYMNIIKKYYTIILLWRNNKYEYYYGKWSLLSDILS